MPKLVGEGFYMCTVRIEYEWKPLRCACCKVFGHVQDECPKNIGSDVVKNLKKPNQAPKGVLVGPKVGFKPVKQMYRPKKNNVNTSGNKKKDVESTKEVSNSNPFDVINSVKNDVDLGINGGTSNLASKEVNSSGSLFWNVGSSSVSTNPIIEKIDKLEKLIIDGKIKLVDDEGKPMKKASERVGYGTNSLLEQWRETYENTDYDYDPYDDYMYEGQKIPDNIQSICDNLDIKLRGHKKK
ncbi:RNA-directed DNA polymerase, eukaryota [Tanacetum coccineum]